jgi:hypothetical protein
LIEETSLKIRLVNDNTLKIKVGRKIINIEEGFKIWRSFGNRAEKYKKQAGIIPDVTKLILPQNNIEDVSLKQ